MLANRVIEQGCKRNVLMFTYDSSVTAPCAYNVNNLAARYGAELDRLRLLLGLR